MVRWGIGRKQRTRKVGNRARWAKKAEFKRDIVTFGENSRFGGSLWFFLVFLL